MSYQIVVGVNASQNAASALRWAFDEARLHDGAVTAVFAWQLPLIGIPGAFDADELEREAKAFLVTEVAAADPPPDLEVSQVVAHGDPSESLVHACERLGADLLVVGAQRRGRFAGLLLDAVANAPCPVVVVKP